jgi:integrase/recombinase XerD
MAGQASILRRKDIQHTFKFLQSPRNRLLFALGIYTGMRVGEIIRLTRDQLFTEHGSVKNVLKVKRLKKKNTVCGHTERVQAHYILRQAFDTLRLDGASTHSMRRTFLTNLSRAGVPLRTVQEISGHSSLSQLQAYLAVDPDDTREAVHRLRY